ncbi:YtxH domain-containing protein [Bacillus testis]|uniref:YtxH domain-containing protein n=1 Tax=Bacillus testis TaxID=1622072 RepID=UPI00067E6DC6|nr:YtxH domain-containing protein [Bacillus testis]
MTDLRNSYNERKKSKLWKGILFGALAGAAVTMLDKHTRETMMESCKNGYRTTKDFVQNPDRLLEDLKETSNKIRSSIESISDDVSFISGKVEEFKEVTPQVVNAVKETKDAIVENHSESNKEPVS